MQGLSREIWFDFSEGDLVILRTDPEQILRIVTGYLIRGENIEYEVSASDGIPSYHRMFELQGCVSVEGGDDE